MEEGATERSCTIVHLCQQCLKNTGWQPLAQSQWGQWKRVRQAARSLRRSLEMKREREKKSAWHRVYSWSTRDKLHLAIPTAVKVTMRAVLQHKAHRVFTILQLTFYNWSSKMPLCSLFICPSHPGTIKHEKKTLINQPQIPCLALGWSPSRYDSVTPKTWQTSQTVINEKGCCSTTTISIQYA